MIGTRSSVATRGRPPCRSVREQRGRGSPHREAGALLRRALPRPSPPSRPRSRRRGGSSAAPAGSAARRRRRGRAAAHASTRDRPLDARGTRGRRRSRSRDSARRGAPRSPGEAARDCEPEPCSAARLGPRQNGSKIASTVVVREPGAVVDDPDDYRAARDAEADRRPASDRRGQPERVLEHVRERRARSAPRRPGPAAARPRAHRDRCRVGRAARAPAATSCRPSSSSALRSARAASSRDRSRRLPDEPVQPPVSSRIVSSSSARSRASSSARSRAPPLAARIAVSGERRSWLPACRIAVFSAYRCVAAPPHRLRASRAGSRRPPSRARTASATQFSESVRRWSV